MLYAARSEPESSASCRMSSARKCRGTSPRSWVVPRAGRGAGSPDRNRVAGQRSNRRPRFVGGRRRGPVALSAWPAFLFGAGASAARAMGAAGLEVEQLVVLGQRMLHAAVGEHQERGARLLLLRPRAGARQAAPL